MGLSTLKPFQLETSYKDYVWGGTRLRPGSPVTAEAWVIYEDNTIADGEYSGRSLAEVAAIEGEALLGINATSQTGNRFPLLIKLLDSEKWLSLQVHPDDESAECLEGPGHFGKMEAWFIIDGQEDAQLISGFREGVSSEDIKKAVGNSKILDLVSYWNVKHGDYLLISPGTIHALGPGLLIYEVQQTSDLTYRVYDWDRPIIGNRKLHIDQAIMTLDSHEKGHVKQGTPDQNETAMRRLISCRYFNLDLISGFSDSLSLDTGGKSFSAFTVVEGKVIVRGKDWKFHLNIYDSLLVPASCGLFSLDISDRCQVLNAYIG